MKKQENQTLLITKENNGFQILSHNIARNKYLSDGAKALYIYLNSHNENFNLTAQNIAVFFNKSIRKIKYHIKELQDAGFLMLERKENGNTYVYKLFASPKLDRVKAFTKENILNALLNNDITLNDIKALRATNKINQKIYNEIMQELLQIIKTEYLNE